MVKLFWDNAESKTSAIPEDKYMMMMTILKMMLLLMMMTMAMMKSMTTMKMVTIMTMTTTYVSVAPCLLLQIAQLRAASTIPPPITRRTAP